VDRRFVDCHSHVVPSGDDGAATIQDGLALCHSAAKHGTAARVNAIVAASRCERMGKLFGFLPRESG